MKTEPYYDNGMVIFMDDSSNIVKFDIKNVRVFEKSNDFDMMVNASFHISRKYYVLEGIVERASNTIELDEDTMSKIASYNIESENKAILDEIKRNEEYLKNLEQEMSCLRLRRDACRETLEKFYKFMSEIHDTYIDEINEFIELNYKVDYEEEDANNTEENVTEEEDKNNTNLAK